MQHHFTDRLIEKIREKHTPLMVGLDPRFAQLPISIRGDAKPLNFAKVANAYRKFCFEIIDVVAPLVSCVKPQSAFFEQVGPHGTMALAEVVEYAQSKELLVIMDAKRGDIGSTAAAYAAAYLGQKPQSSWGCDALTVNPYLGDDSLTPFVETASETNSGIFVLVKTSNPGSKMLQEKLIDDRPVYEVVGEHINQLARSTISHSGYGAVGAVIGATYPEQLAELRQKMPNTFFLVPGFGAQGGTAADIAGAFDASGVGGVVNSSRGIIFAHARDEYAGKFNDWQGAVEQATRDAIDNIRQFVRC